MEPCKSALTSIGSTLKSAASSIIGRLISIDGGAQIFLPTGLLTHIGVGLVMFFIGRQQGCSQVEEKNKDEKQNLVVKNNSAPITINNYYHQHQQLNVK